MMTFQVGVSGDDSLSRLQIDLLLIAFHDADLEIGRVKDLFGDRPNCERFACPGPGDDPKPFAATRELAHARAMVLLEEGLDV